MVYDSLSVQEIGTSKLLIYKEDLNNLNFKLRLPNILTFVRTNFIDAPLCYFDITEKVALSEIQRFPLREENIYKILKTATSLIVSINSQGLGVDSVLFHPDYVFVDEKFNPYFIPLSISGNTIREAKTFLKGILTNSVIEPIPQDGFTQKILNYFNAPQFTFEKLDDLLSNQYNSPASEKEAMPYPFFAGNKEYTRKHAEKQKNKELTDFLENQLAAQSAYEHTTNFSGRHADFDDYQTQEPPLQAPAFDNTPSYKPSAQFTPPLEKEMNSAPVQNTVSEQPPTEQVEIAPAPPQEKQVQEATPTFAQAEVPPAVAPVPEVQVTPAEATAPPVHPELPAEQSATEEIAEQKEVFPKGTPYLIYGEKLDAPIEINTFPFKIGRHPEMVDYIINSPYIGRTHAFIDKSDTGYILVDDNATNGTFYNGKRLTTHETVPLVSSDMIQFAKYPFQFIIK